MSPKKKASKNTVLHAGSFLTFPEIQVLISNISTCSHNHTLYNYEFCLSHYYLYFRYAPKLLLRNNKKGYIEWVGFEYNQVPALMKRTAERRGRANKIKNEFQVFIFHPKYPNQAASTNYKAIQTFFDKLVDFQEIIDIAPPSLIYPFHLDKIISKKLI